MAKELEKYQQIVNEIPFYPELTHQCDSYNKTKKFRILSLDGGGIKCLLQTIILEMFEGAEVEIITEGEDEVEAFNKIKELLEKEFDYN